MNPDPKRGMVNLVGRELKNIAMNKEWREIHKETSEEYHLMSKVQGANQDIGDSENSFNEFKEKMDLLTLNLKFELILLSFVFSSDDGIIDKHEKKAIKKHFNSYKDKLNKIVKRKLDTFEVQIESINDIKVFVSLNEITECMITNSIKTVETICIREKYHQIIQSIKNSL